MKKTVYFAAPLFNQAEKDFNQQCVNKLEASGFTVFFPQRDVPDMSALSVQDRSRKIFALDRDQILAADFFLIVLDGRVPDEGACIELGMAYCQRFLTSINKKLLVGLRTDKRSFFLNEPLNLMVSEPLDFIASDCDELLDYLNQTVNQSSADTSALNQKLI